MAEPSLPDVLPGRKPHWYAPTPAKFLYAVLVMQGVLFLSAQYRWFWFNERKGYTVLITLAATCVLLLLFPLVVAAIWFIRSKAQFSLGTMLLIFPVLAVPCGWLAREMSLARERQQLVQRVVGTGGLWGGRAFPNQMLGALPKRRPPPFLQNLFGNHFFCDVDHLWVNDRELMQRIEIFDQIEQLQCDSAIDADVQHLRGLQRLARLKLGNPQITDVGVAALSELPALEVLEVNRAAVTGVGLRRFDRLNRIKEISMNETPMTDVGLMHLGKLKSLETLRLEKSSVTDAGLEHLGGLGELRMLMLEGSKVTDEGAASLEKVLPYCIVDN
jgi:hypothetical protein